VFFCKYNDPIYVKMEKLEVMIRLSSDRNIDQVLLELKEYAQEVGRLVALGCRSESVPLSMCA
jgi:vesicle coat complex subunit